MRERLAGWARKTASAAAAVVLLWGIASRAQMGGMVPPVSGAPVVAREVSSTITLVGSAEPRMRSLVASEAEGRVVEVPAEEGDLVRTGQVLARLDSLSFALDLRGARASLAEAQAQLAVAEHDLDRARQLFQDDIRTPKDFQDAEADHNVWAQRVERLRAEAERLQVDLERTQIRAPFAGAVVSKQTEVGEWVREGGPIVELVDISRVHVLVGVPERHVNSVRVGDATGVTFDALGGRAFHGKVIAVIPQADENTRTLPVKVELPNADLAIKGGMLARVTLSVGEARAATLVPKDALVTRGDQVFVYVVEADTVRFVPIALGQAHDTSVEVEGPLRPGELVVVRGNERLRPGQRVQLTK